jgi:tetratricopeptide (TPR) repeat protein
MKIRHAFFVLIYLVAFALCVKNFREPDLWWQIRTGEWIMDHHKVPTQDVFSYTMKGENWINIKWGFEVIAAVVSSLSGPESVYVLQGIINCFIVFFLFKISKIFFRQKYPEETFRKNPYWLLSSSLCISIIFIATEYRMIGRPEMISHLFTLIFLFILQKNKNQPGRQLYLLIPLQLIWANMHEAFGVGLVLLFIYTASAWAKYFLSHEGRKDSTQLSLVTGLSILSVLINPRGLALLTRPFNIMSQVYANKYTTELSDISSDDWWKKEAFLALIISLLSIIILLIRQKNKAGKESNIKNLLLRISDPYLLTIVAFVYLGITAYRNLIFLSLVSFPVFHLGVFELLNSKKPATKNKSIWANTLALLLPVIFYVSIVTDKYYEWTKSRDRFGFEINSTNNPVGAAEYIQQHNLAGKKCFSDYLTSSYLLWKLQPSFETYIDLRDLDVFPAQFFNDFLRDVFSPLDFHRLDSIQKFDYAVVYRPQFDALHAYLYNDSIYALKYVDAVAAVYEKTDNFTRDDIFSDCKPQKAGMFASSINRILNPFYKAFDYSSVENDYIAASYFLNVERIDLAKKRADALAGRNSYKGKELLGQIEYRMSQNEQNDSVKNILLSNAESLYRESIRQNSDYAPALFGLGAVHIAQKNFSAAVKDLSKCLEIDPENYQAHLSIAESYRGLMDLSSTRKDEYRKLLIHHFTKANSLNPGNPMVIANMGFVYFQMNDCDHAVEYLSRVVNDERLSKEDRTAAQNCIKQCGS